MTRQFLSAYVLTHNSQKHLDEVLARVARVADDVVVLDSGSMDDTREIAERRGSRFHQRRFDDFIRQREHAASLCRHDWVLFVDSDEYLDDELIDAINALKAEGFRDCDAYILRREWYVLGRRVHGVYPVKCPDFRVRLYHRGKGRFDQMCPVHEKLVGFDAVGRIARGAIHHHTFETPEEFDRKLECYIGLAIQGMIFRNKKTGPVRARVHAVSAFLKWFLVFQCWRDGRVGLICSRYAYRYTLAKYLGLLRQRKGAVAA
ncbi:MAG TPA: glycosyltransferase family 2 protein [Gammaproteobacteria bacterium]